MSKTVHRTLEAKLAALQGPEWDSSDEETFIVPLESNKKRAPAKAKTSKTKKSAKSKKPKQSRVIYLGHLPPHFTEPELMGFLSQFGVVTRLKLSRSRKTANSKGFAFCEFAKSQVAAIVADTMAGYFLNNKRLVCHVVPLEQVRKNLFDGWDRKFTKVDWQAKHREQVNEEKTAEVMKVITQRLLAREKKKKAALKAMGIDYDFPGYEASAELLGEVETVQTDNTSANVKKRRKESMDVNTEQGGSPKKKQKSMVETSGASSLQKKKARKDSTDSVESSSEKKKKRKDSVESQGSSSEKKKKRKDSLDSHESSSVKKTSKQKDSMDSQGSLPGKKKKRKDSMDSQGSSSSKKKHSKRKSSEDIHETPTNKTREKHVVKTEAKKKKTSKKRRASA